MHPAPPVPAPVTGNAPASIDAQHPPLPAPMAGDLSRFPADIPASPNAAYIKPTPVPKPAENLTLAAAQQAAVPATAQELTAALPGGDVPPQVIRRIQPDYPIEALRAHDEGEVQLKITIDGSGHVSDVHVSRSSRSRALDRAAMDAARNWQFRPAVHDGQRVSSTVTESVEFHLGD